MILRTARLQLNTWRAAVAALWERLQTWYAQRTCPHLFRAARINDRGGRVCKICGLSEPLSQEEYFAQFGEQGWTAIYGARK